MDKSKNIDALLQKANKDEIKKGKGKLKIFFGYAAGVGKTYAMLEAAHFDVADGKDVVVGYVEPHDRMETTSLLAGLEVLPTKEVSQGTLQLHEFDLDVVLQRHPQLVLVDELAHTNAKGMRHGKRYQDIEELLSAGIDVYTTVNVQHIESLNDIVAGITSVEVRERIPDYVFDLADNIELVDIEPEELLERLNRGNIYNQNRVQEAKQNFFTKDNLFALREIALRRMADKVNNEVEEEKLLNRKKEFYTNEVILTCISTSPSNLSVIRSASRLANAFKGKLIALYVEKTDVDELNDKDKECLKNNMKLAEDLNARIITISGDDVAMQIAEYVKISGVSKIVLGRSMNKHTIPFISKPKLVDQLTRYIPNTDIFIIPDAGEVRERIRLIGEFSIFSYFKEFTKAISIILITSLLSLWLFEIGVSDSNILTVYFLGVLLSAVVVKGIFYNVLTTVLSVLLYNFLFIEPRFTFEAYDRGFLLTVFIMLVASILVSTLSTRIQLHAQQAAIKAHRTDVLLETTQQLQNAKTVEEIYGRIANQIISLLGHNVIIYPQKEAALQKPKVYEYDINFDFTNYINADEEAVAQWVFKNNRHAGASTNTLPGAKCLYLAIRGSDEVFGVIGIVVNDEQPLDAFEKSLLIAMLSECGMSIDRIETIQEYNAVSHQAKQEKLRYTLLRSISHDLRTPLTSISGNAMTLLENADKLDQAKRKAIYDDIYEDSNWLIQLSENLLSMTRLENSEMQIKLESDLIDDVIEEAIRNVTKRNKTHIINYQRDEDYLMVDMDSRLMLQVMINLIDNAIKYSPDETEIKIKTDLHDGIVEISVADVGKGISEKAKEHIFDLFYTEHNNNGDSRKSLGLGLYLCNVIVDAHNGSIQVNSNTPKGTIFTLKLPESKVI